jgi:hypothetical protein
MGISGKERTIRALNFEKVDRVPMWGGWCENADFLEIASGHQLKYKFVSNEWENPMRAALKAFKNVGVDITCGLQLPKSAEMTSKYDSLNGYMSWDVSSSEKYGYTPLKVVKYVESLPSSSEVREDFNFDQQYLIYTTQMSRAQDECGDDILWMSRADTIDFHGNFSLFG